MACSSIDKLKLLLENARWRLRSAGYGLEKLDIVIQMTLFTLPKGPSKAVEDDTSRGACQNYMIYLQKTEGDILRNVVISPYAPRTEALRVTNKVDSSSNAKLKGRPRRKKERILDASKGEKKQIYYKGPFVSAQTGPFFIGIHHFVRSMYK